MTTPRLDRRARNEAIFRNANEAIKNLVRELASVADQPYAFVCECDDMSCTAQPELTIGDYERIRADDTHFLVAVGHHDPARERVIERHEHYLLVEKQGRAAELARESAPK